MARIRTIKPEFWTDEKIVGLPFEARLLFIGMWNFADDTGTLEYSPDRIGMQVFPGEVDLNISALIDLLSICGLIEIWGAVSNRAIKITNWSRHQKIDNPSRKTAIVEGYRKLAIPSEARIAVARKYGCEPGGKCKAECYYCGMPGEIQWWKGTRGKPTKWVTLSDLEFDHVESELNGGSNGNKNIVLACRSCNRGKREFDEISFFVERNVPLALASPSEPYPSEGKGKERNIDVESHSTAVVEQVFNHWKSEWNHPTAKLDQKRKKAIQAALKLYPPETLCLAITGFKKSEFHTGRNDRHTVYDGLPLLLRDADHIEKGIALANGKSGEVGWH